MSMPFLRKPHFRSAPALACAVAAFLSTAPADAAEWRPLFNGKNLDGWVKRGGSASYRVENKTIVGTTVQGSRNTFLCTDRDYGDFILELEFRVDPRMNSGVQIRSASDPDYRNGVVHGYQVEIDPSPRAWSGGIYDESRRGWINNLKDNEPARNAFRQGEWNRYRVEAVGDWIRTWINGVPAANLRDSLSLTGFIALQVHGTNREEPMEIAWRDIRIQDLGRHEWRPLFDGKSLKGWRALPGGAWSVIDGVIHGQSEAAERRHGILVTDKRFSDFTARARFLVEEGDSGFYFRVDETRDGVGVHGFQVEVDTTYETGGLYETGRRGWVVQRDADEPRREYKKGEWNTLTVSAHRRRVVVHLNGAKTAELNNDPGRTEGHIGLQLHGSQRMRVQYKDIEILRPAAP